MYCQYCGKKIGEKETRVVSYLGPVYLGIIKFTCMKCAKLHPVKLRP